MHKKGFPGSLVAAMVLFIFAATWLGGCKASQEKTPAEAKGQETQPVQADKAVTTEAKGSPMETNTGGGVKAGNVVKVQYTGTFADGKVFDKSSEGSPLQFTVGAGEMIPGFEKAVIGMKLNETKKVTLKAEDAYGQSRKELIKKFPRESVPSNIKPEVGMRINLRGNDGNPVPATITEVNEKEVTLDINHPLAGRSLTFEIKVVSIE